VSGRLRGSRPTHTLALGPRGHCPRSIRWRGGASLALARDVATIACMKRLGILVSCALTVFACTGCGDTWRTSGRTGIRFARVGTWWVVTACVACGLFGCAGPAGETAASDASAASGRDAGALDAAPDELLPGPACGDASGPGMGLGVITTLATGVVDPSLIAVDSTSVYWVKGASDGSVISVPLDGGAATTLASGQDTPYGIAVDSTSVYWTTSNGAGSVMKVALDGGGPPATLATGQVEAHAIAVDATNVYWVTSGNGVTGTVVKVPLDGGSATTLASGQSDPFGIAVDGTNVYWTSTLGEHDGNGVALAESLGGGTISTLVSAPATGLFDGMASLLAGNIASNGTSVYFTGGTDGQSILKVPVGGGAATTLASGQPHPFGIALDGANVYWTNMGSSGRAQGTGVPGLAPPTNDGAVMKVPLGGGTVTTLASCQSIPMGIAVDATSVYWITAAPLAAELPDGGIAPENGAVMKTPK
jgi:hypothetical protein